MPEKSARTPRMTTGAVARRLGISPTTLRSWDRRYGMGPAVRDGGRHRRWTVEDIAVLEDMCRLTTSGVPPSEAAGVALSRANRSHANRSHANRSRADRSPVADPEPLPAAEARRTQGPGPGGGLPLGDIRQEFRGLARAAVRLDGPAMDELLAALVHGHGLVAAWEEAIAPTLHAVGRKWESSGDRYVEVEHLLSWHVSTVLRQVVGNAPPGPRDAAPVLMACVPGEQHSLPLEALAAGLAERELPLRMLGAAVPGEALAASVRRTGPSAVVLWSQSRRTADRTLARQVAATAFGVRGARTRPLVVLAGPGWGNRAPGPGMLRPTGLREALDVLARHCAAAAGPFTSPTTAHRS
ncbi:MerR family transcriptional regulator [Streptomyces sp. A0592]|uniref:MerR family transcriptional regulator n=1 Tax=Streptomyces sp. A0592 TaxID=2563099 RepID=UPI00109EE2CA|nr:MerR family transcriptional regulator [Streptomyces sp. A0592]THA81639.1 MerR family transcriptional regulator [Streptomyces sp. A0592]